MDSNKDREKLAVFAAALRAEEGWLGFQLGRLGVEIDAGGCYRPSEASAAIEKAARLVAAANRADSLPPDVAETVMRIQELGTDENSARTWFASELRKYGLEVSAGLFVTGKDVHSLGHVNPIFTLRRADGRQMKIITHVASRLKQKTHQVGFSASRLNDENLSWFAFIARPWARVFLRRRSEIIKNLRSDKQDTTCAFLTFSPGIFEFDLENRIRELIETDDDWCAPNSGDHSTDGATPKRKGAVERRRTKRR